MQKMILFVLIIQIQVKLSQISLKNATPLHFAVKNNSKDMFELLISRGADINAKDFNYLIIIVHLLIIIINNK